jgi:hypothetical protein
VGLIKVFPFFLASLLVLQWAIVVLFYMPSIIIISWSILTSWQGAIAGGTIGGWASQHLGRRITAV